METTRHFTATVYVVNDGETALHDHKRHRIALPPGGHIDRDEVPHEAGLREVREEMGLDPTLVDDTRSVDAPEGRALPQPRHQMLYDINVHDGQVGHQHIDLIYYATVPSRTLEPQAGERREDAWQWYSAEELRKSNLPTDIIQFGVEAIQAARTRER